MSLLSFDFSRRWDTQSRRITCVRTRYRAAQEKIVVSCTTCVRVRLTCVNAHRCVSCVLAFSRKDMSVYETFQHMGQDMCSRTTCSSRNLFERVELRTSVLWQVGSNWPCDSASGPADFVIKIWSRQHSIADYGTSRGTGTWWCEWHTPFFGKVR